MSEDSILETGWYSDIGNRETQQDSCRISFHHGVLLTTVCDGMGGFQGGELASSTAVNHLHTRFESTEASDAEFYLNILDELDAQVFFLKDDTNRRLKAGTTIVSVIIDGNKMSWLSVGDSRIYIVRDNEMIQATRDHNYREMLNELLSKGSITKKQYEAESKKYTALTSYVGMGGIKLFDISTKSFGLKDGDLILLTSDGLYNAVQVEKITEVSGEKISEIIDFLSKALELESEKSKDNITFIVIKYHVQSKREDFENETEKMS